MDHQLKIKIMSDAYMEAIDFTECHEDNPELYNAIGFSDELILHAINTCKKFLEITGDKIPDSLLSQAGHDLWLTRNGHGAGFWDRPELYGEDLANYLTSLCEHGNQFSEVWVYTGDDNLIYVMGDE